MDTKAIDKCYKGKRRRSTSEESDNHSKGKNLNILIQRKEMT